MVLFALVPLVALASNPAAHDADNLASSLPPPLPIVGGSEAATCEFPATVAMLEDDETPVMCSGSLLTPDIVLTAAHCLIPERPIIAIGFGEAGQVFGEPAFTVAPTECEAHPDWNNFGYNDVAYCRLAQPVTTVPIVPLLGGCESDVLQPGTELTIVGFGATWGNYDNENDMVISMGVGAKRWTTQTIDYVDFDTNEVNMVGDNGSQSACFGDSGGPAYVRLADDTWRVVGAGSHLYDPGGFPDPIEKNNICGVGVAYSFAPGAIDWLESSSGVDLTPCWDGDEFVGGDDCGDFPLAPGTAAGSWKGGCAGGVVGGGEAVCEAASEDTGGGESSGGDEASTSSADDTGTSSGGDGTTSPDPTTDSPTTNPTTTSTTSSDSVTATGAVADDSGSTDTSGAGEDDAGGGCGCRSTRNRTTSAWAVPLLALLGRRRRGTRR